MKYQGGSKTVQHSQRGHSECGLGHWVIQIIEGKSLAFYCTVNQSFLVSQAIALERICLFFVDKHLHSYPQARESLLLLLYSHPYPSLGWSPRNHLKDILYQFKTLKCFKLMKKKKKEKTV